MKYLSILACCVCLLWPYTAWSKPDVDQNFARSLVKDNLERGNYQLLAERLQGFDRSSLVKLRLWLKTNENALVEPQYSIFARWSFYQIIYYIDDQLGELRYDFVHEGILGELLDTLFGCAYYAFTPLEGSAFDVFITPATVITADCDIFSSRGIRIFIRRTAENSSAPARHEVVKAEALQNAPVK